DAIKSPLLLRRNKGPGDKEIKWLRGCGSLDLGRNRIHANPTPFLRAFVLHDAGDLGVQRVVLASANVEARVNPRAALADDDAPSRHDFTAEAFDAEILRVAVPPVPTRTLSFFVRHG